MAPWGPWSVEPRAKATAPGWAQTPVVPRRLPEAGPGQWRGVGSGCLWRPPSQRRSVWVQFRPLPRSQILIRARQQEVSDPQPSLAPWLPWGPCHVNEEQFTGHHQGVPAQLGPGGPSAQPGTPSLSPCAPITAHRPHERSSNQSPALISCLGSQHRLCPQTDIRPSPGTSTFQLSDLRQPSLPEPGFLYKTGMVRGPTSRSALRIK